MIREIVEAPHRWPKYLHGTHRFVLRRFPFSVIYLDDSEVVTIIAVAAQQAKAWVLETSDMNPAV